jgi:hypothetical protein
VAGSEAAGGGVDDELRAPAQELFHGDPRHQPGGRGAEAVVCTEAERQHPRRPPRHVQLLGVRTELARVAVGGGVEQHDLAAGGDDRAVQLDVAGDRAGETLDGRGQPEQLLDRVRDQRGIAGEPRTLVRVGVQELGRAAQQTGGRVVATGDHREGEPEDPHRRQSVPIGCLHQLGHHVVGGVRTPPLDQLGEVGEQLGDRVAGEERIAQCVRGHDPAGPGVEALPVDVGHTEIAADDEARKRLEQRRDDVAAAGLAQPVDPLGAELAYVGLEPGHLSWGEAADDEPPERAVVRRVEEHHRADLVQPGRRELAVGEREPLRGGIGLGVERGRGDVVVARQHPVVPVVDVVHRVVLAQRGVHAERVPPALLAAWHVRRTPGHPHRLSLSRGGRARCGRRC